MIDTLVVYAAGFFDGEGCISIDVVNTGRCRRPQHRLRTVTANTDLAVLKLLQQRWGGDMRTTQARLQRRTCYQWYLTARQAEKFLRDVLPWLQVKRAQAELALKFIDTILLKAIGRRRLPEDVFTKRESLRLQLKGMHIGKHTLA